jgi:hypothetical protein
MFGAVVRAYQMAFGAFPVNQVEELAVHFYVFMSPATSAGANLRISE